MESKTIRSIDTRIGVLGCLVLTGMRRMLDGLGLRKDACGPVRKILFIKLVEQGASVVAYPALQRAIDLVGRANVYFCVFEENREVLDLMQVLPEENILAIRTNSFGTLVRDVLRTVIRVRRLGVDASIDMEFFARSSVILGYLCGAPRRVGLHRFTSETPYRGDLMTHRVEYNPYLHTSLAYLLLVEAIERDPAEVPLIKVETEGRSLPIPRFVPTEAEVEHMRKTLHDAVGWAEGVPLVLLNPNPNDSLRVRKWPADRFVELARRLLVDHPDMRLAIIGTPSERAEAEALCKTVGAPRIVSMAGKTTLRELFVLLTLADVLVTNDSGPTHFASMTGAHVVALFGPETPVLFGPMGDRVRVIHKPFACSPCLSVFNHRVSPCTDNVCIQSITVDEVQEAVQRCLQAAANR